MDSPTYYITAAGVLRYNGESDSQLYLPNIIPTPPTDYEVCCQYCGQKAGPPLDLTWIEPETSPYFCCTQRQQLHYMLMRHRVLLNQECSSKMENLPSDEDNLEGEMEDLLTQSKTVEDVTTRSKGDPKIFKTTFGVNVYRDYAVYLPVAEMFSPTSKGISFRLSCVSQRGSWTLCPFKKPEHCLKFEEEEKQVLVPVCDHKGIQFGICHHQEGTGFVLKYYSKGRKFLTLFPDGSAQVFYPSGLLALVVVVTKENGRVCIVYDNSGAPNQPIRAVFQSDGRAACYHSSGSIWLVLNRTGGQCLSDAGAKVCRWSWGSQLPTPLHPIFLPLNKSVAVRVLKNQQVFVSFLAQGQQAKFHVGACCVQGGYRTPTSKSPVLKEQLFLKAAKIKIQLVIQGLHQCLMTPSHPRLPETRLTPHLRVAAERLLEDSAYVMMSDNDRAFIHGYLKDG
ncbi:uncharacterized protein [Embiotoca jacksoni]|uniref:uncharacterized protein isoform X1 n=1 Tax=Embiotoca jacksoni TaxID=100190 RepID=UPI003704D264